MVVKPMGAGNFAGRQTAKVYVFSVSVLCVGNVLHSKGAIDPWKEKIDGSQLLCITMTVPPTTCTPSRQVLF